MAGFECIYAIDKLAAACETYRHNFPTTPVICGDIAEVSCEEVWEMLGEVEPAVIIGGPPCQGFSVAGKRNPKDPRNYRLLDFARFVAFFHPKLFIFENVRGILSAVNPDNEKFIDVLLGAFPDYQITHKILLASEFGVPQNRYRVFFVGVRNDLNLSWWRWPRPTHSQKHAGQMTLDGRTLKPVITLEGACADLFHILPNNFVTDPRYEGLPNHVCSERTAKFWANRLNGSWEQGARYVDPKKPAPTVMDNHGNTIGFVPIAYTDALNPQVLSLDKPAHTIRQVQFKWIYSLDEIRRKEDGHLVYEGLRSFTVRELARLQSFPDSFIFKGTLTDMYVMVGNSVPIELGRHLGLAAKAFLKRCADQAL